MDDPTVQPYLILSVTTASSNSTTQPPSDDGIIFMKVRIIALWIMFVIGVVGNTMVVGWLWFNRKKTTRMNRIVLGLATADLCVCFFVMFVSAIATMNKYQWRLGDAMCRIHVFLISLSLMASSYMLVLLALDRHMAIRRPLKPPFPFGIYKMIGLGWACAFILSLPQLFVWHLESKKCTTTMTPFYKVIYIFYASLAQCLVPFLIITVAYVRITKKIWDKAQTSRRQRLKQSASQEMYSPAKNEQVALNADQHRQQIMKQARSKSLKMSIVIVLAYVCFGLPYFLSELIRVLRPDIAESMSNVAIAYFGISAVANSAVNPYIFLFFTVRGRKSQK